MSYYEFKYVINNSHLNSVIDIVDSVYSATDLYPIGSVHSVYYDTANCDHYFNCKSGNVKKLKYRVRYYDEQKTSCQAQIKIKDMHLVDKYKHKFKDKSVESLLHGNVLWHHLFTAQDQASHMSSILETGQFENILWPVVNVSYTRRRYRTYDYRFNIDSQIVVEAVPGHPMGVSGKVILPISVLELKTIQIRPYIPFLAHFTVSQTSFSKYAFGIQLLLHEIGAANKYL